MQADLKAVLNLQGIFAICDFVLLAAKVTVARRRQYLIELLTLVKDSIFWQFRVLFRKVKHTVNIREALIAYMQSKQLIASIFERYSGLSPNQISCGNAL